MSSILEKISDNVLKRLYKTILKRTLGPYLASEITLENFSVSSRDGYLMISDLSLDTSAINEKLEGFPFIIRSISISSLTTKMSYSAFIEEGFSVSISGLRIRIQKKDSLEDFSSPEMCAKDNRQDEIDSNEISAETDEPEGVLFIVNWIEVLIASLKASVSDINIEFVFDNTIMICKLSSISFKHRLEKSWVHESSLNVSNYLSGPDASKIGGNIAQGKTICLGSFSMMIGSSDCHDESDLVNVLEWNDGAVIEIANDSDIRVQLPSIRFFVDLAIVPRVIRDINALREVFDKLCPASNTQSLFTPNDALQRLISLDPVLGNALWDEEIKTKTNHTSDDEFLTNVLKKLNSAKQISSSVQSAFDRVVSSDFDDGDIGEIADMDYMGSDFQEFDMSKSSSDSMFLSTRELGSSTMTTSSKDMFFSTVENEPSSFKPIATKKIHLQLHVGDAALILRSSSREEALAIYCQDISMIGYLSDSKSINLSINKFGCFSIEKSCHFPDSYMAASKSALLVGNDTIIPVFSFHNQERNDFIIDPPYISIDFKSSIGGTVELTIELEPIILSIHTASINNWVEEFSSFPKLESNDNTSQDAYIVNISVPLVDVFVHASARENDNFWQQLSESLDLRCFPERWIHSHYFPDSFSQYTSHINPNYSRGGICISCENLVVQAREGSNVTSSEDKQDVSSQKLSVGIYVSEFSDDCKSSIQYWESPFFFALRDSSDANSKISIRKGKHLSPNNPLQLTKIVVEQSDESDKEDGRILYDDRHILYPPQVSFANVFRVEAYRTVFDIRQREFCALIALATSMSPSTSNNSSPNLPPNVNVTDKNSSDGFGILLYSQCSTLRISENTNEYSRMTTTQQNESNADNPEIPQGVSNLLFSDPFSLCMAVSQPLIKVFSRNQDIFFSIQADDISMFEMNLSQCEELSKGIIGGSSRAVRVGPLAYCVPFLHRTTLHGKSGVWNISGDKNKKSFDSLSDLWSPGDDHTFRLQLLLRESENTWTPSRSVSFNMSLQDVTIRYDAASSWLLKVVDLFTPLTPSQIVSNRRRRNLLWLKYYDSSNFTGEFLENIEDTEESHDGSSSSVENPFEKTDVSVRVRKCIIDYCCQSVSSRLLFSVGHLSMSTSILSNTSKFSLAFKVDDISLHISNKLLFLPSAEQSPLDPFAFRSKVWENNSSKGAWVSSLDKWIDRDNFLDIHGFVQILTLSSMTNIVSLDGSESGVVVLHLDIKSCRIYACLDSLQILVDTIMQWWKETKAMTDKYQDMMKILETTRHDSGTIEPEVESESPAEDVVDVPKFTLQSFFDRYSAMFDNSTNQDPMSSSYNENAGKWEPLYEDDGDESFASLQLNNLCENDQHFKQVVSKGDKILKYSSGIINLDDACMSDSVTLKSTDMGLHSDSYVPKSKIGNSFYDFDDDLFVSCPLENSYSPEMQKILDSDKNKEDGIDIDLLASYWGQQASVDKSLARKHPDGQSDLDLNRFQAVDGIHNAMQITIDEKMLIQQPGRNIVGSEYRSTRDRIESLENIDEFMENHYRTNLSKASEVSKNSEDLTFDAEWRSSEDEEMYDEFKLEAGIDGNWLINPSDVSMDLNYVQIPCNAEYIDDGFPELETKKLLATSLKIMASVHLSLFLGRDFDDGRRALSTGSINSNQPNHEISTVKPKKSSMRLSKNNASREVHFSESSDEHLMVHKDVADFGGRISVREDSESSAKTVSKSRESDSSLEISVKSIDLSLDMFNKSTDPVKILPSQRVVLRTGDFFISYTLKKNGGKKKVFGQWKTNKKYSSSTPMFLMTFIGYGPPEAMKHVSSIAILPLLCHLDGDFINLIKNLASSPGLKQPADDNVINSNELSGQKQSDNPSSDMYFERIKINDIDIKIDYEPNFLDVSALQSGDFTQLLNLFPLDGLEITLKSVELIGVPSLKSLGILASEEWINNIYRRQIHRVVSGVAAFRGISNIGADIHDLMVIPLQDYRQSRGLLSDLTVKTSKLLQTVAKETVNLTYNITTLVAKGLSGLAKEVTPVSITTGASVMPSRIVSNTLPSNKKQPNNVRDGLVRAYDVMSREINQTMDSVVGIPIHEYRRSGTTGYVQAVVRVIPVAIVRPVAGAAEGLAYTLLGIRNSLNPDRQLEEEDRWFVDQRN